MKVETDQVHLMVKCGQMKLRKLNKGKLINSKNIVMLVMHMDMDVVDIITRYSKKIKFQF